MLSLIGRYPTYMRPPYFEFNSAVLSVMKSLKYRVIIADLDTNDWQENPDASFNAFKSGLDAKGSIVLAHDPRAPTVNTLLPRMIAELKRRKMKCMSLSILSPCHAALLVDLPTAVTVGECLGEHPNNWYRYGPRS